MKKILKIFLCIGLLLQNFMFAIPVNATGSNLSIKINSVKQGNDVLVMNDNKYVVNNYDSIKIFYELENKDPNKNYYLSFSSNGNGYGTNYREGEALDIRNPEFRYTHYTLKICDNFSCEVVYATKDIYFEYAQYESVNNSLAYVQSLSQAGEQINFDINNNQLNVNNIEDITVSVKAENLEANVTYSIKPGLGGSFEEKVLGSELMAGYNFTYSPLKEELHYFNLYRGDTLVSDITYKTGDEEKSLMIGYNENNNVSNYDFEPFYTNDSTVRIKKSTDIPTEYPVDTVYYIDSNYHNSTKTLSFKLTGNGKYTDNNYSINVKGLLNGSVTYTKDFTANGLDLNDGYNIELSDYVMTLATQTNLYESPNKLIIRVGNVTKEVKVLYNSLGDNPYIESNLFFENGKKNLSTFRGDGGFNWSSGVADTNKDAFTKYSSMYINYRGNSFKETEEYDYILEYGYLNLTEPDGLNENNLGYNYVQTLKTGKVIGKTFNNDGLNFEIKNNSNYQMPTYRLTIKKGTEVIYSNSPAINLINSPTLANASLSANNKNLYIKTTDYNYIATRNAPIKMIVSGIGFENKEYDFELSYYSDNGPVSKAVKFNGNDLNNGNAVLTIDNDFGNEVEHLDLYVTCDSLEFEAPIQGGFGITFVDSKDYFPNLTKYVIDNGNDIIKNIKKNTSVADFINDMSVANNGKVKIYEKTGTNEATGNVGTGMIAKVLNEYDRNLLDLDVVVKGDVTGDGSISITDLVKTKRDLANLEKLTGVYSTAGDITGSGSIGITDLVKMSRDVAEIEEID